MGKYMMRKCRGMSEVAVMEVSQVVGVRTRAMTTALAAAKVAAAKRKRAVSSKAAEYQIAYLQLRSRRLVMTMPPRISRSGVKSASSGSPWCLSVDRGEISRCESNASCEVPDLRSDDHREVVDCSETTAACYSSFRRQREMTPLSNQREEEELYDLESTAERQSPPRPTAVMTSADAEIEEFFAAAEKKEAQRFATTYNFDVVNNVALEGRYEWVRVFPGNTNRN